MNITKIINWLRSIELLAGNVYREASEQFLSDQKFSSFLSRLSQDENWHSYLLGDALIAVQDKEDLPEFGIKVDSVTKHEIESPFRDLYYLINRQRISKKELVDCIVKAEFSEWNSIFLYALKLVGDFSVDFKHVVATIETHKNKIIRFLEELPEGIKPPEDLFKLPKVWEHKILIIEEDGPFREFIAGMLMGMGKIELAPTSLEGLEMINKDFYNVIISNLDVQVKSGMELYLEAVKGQPKVSRNFLFYSDESSPDSKAFLQENHLFHMKKPIPIKTFKNTVQEIMDKAL